MQSQDELSTFRPLNNMLKAPTQRGRVIRVLMQALHSMGFHQTARHLEKESDVGLVHESVRRVLGSLEREEYAAAILELDRVNIPEENKQDMRKRIGQLRLLSMIHRGEHEAVVQSLSSSDISQQQKVAYYQMIALGSCPDIEQLRERHQSIIDKLTKQQQQSNCIEKMIKNFLQQPAAEMDKQQYPPTRVVAETLPFAPVKFPVTFLRFDLTGSIIAVVGESKGGTEVTILRLDGGQLKLQKYYRKQHRLGSICSVRWIGSESFPLLAFCCFQQIFIVKILQPTTKQFYIQRKDHNIPNRLLCMAWHPVTELLYVGGLFNQIFVFDNKWEMVSSVTPFVQCRDMMFVDGDLYAMSATDGLIIRYCLQKQQQLSHFTAQKPFMDMRFDPSSKNILATSQQHIFILDYVTLRPIHTLPPPQNPKLYKIQAMMVKGWLMVFNQQLTGRHLADNTYLNTAWNNCAAVDASSNGLLATFSGKVRVLGPADGPSPQELKQNGPLSGNIGQENDMRIISESDQQLRAQLQSQQSDSQSSSEGQSVQFS